MDTTKNGYALTSCTHCSVSQTESFCELRSSDLSDLDDLRFRRICPAGTTLFVQGQRADGAFILCEGRLKLRNSSADGRIVSFGTATAGEMLGLSAAISDGEYEVTAEALETCQVNFIARDELRQFLLTHPAACLNALRQTSQNYQSAVKRICSLAASDTVANKLARLLLDLDKNRDQETLALSMDQPLTHEILAETLGVSRETITRTLKRFKESNVATLRGQSLVIHNRARLAAIAKPGSDAA
ncbi:MAG: Crp/Fnr family transcriptional regulator [Chloracidobacterium sp.]|nr:Crp/Fnr family transcriptional regulator [Chloracidobacterium sp.]